MRSAAALPLAALLALILETTVLHHVPGLPVVPDFVLVLVVYLAMHHQGVRGALGAFVLGYALDTFSGTVFGLNAFAMMCVYLGVCLVARMLWTEGGVPAMAVVFVAALGRGLALVLGGALLGDAKPFWDHLARHGIFDAAAAALVAPLAFFVLVGREKRIVGGA